jgi:cell division protein FtsL
LTFFEGCGTLEMEAWMTNSKVQRVLPVRFILLILMGLLILYQGVGFVRQARVNYERRKELHRIEQQLAVAEQENAKLEEQLTDVGSTEAAEKWARENAWAKEDETSVVVVAPAGQAPSGSQQDPEVVHDSSSNREAWWNLFFGENQ